MHSTVGYEAPAQVGELIAGRYRITEQLGRGASGVVFRARDEAGNHVALKVLFRELCDGRQLPGRLQREGEILRRLQGSHIVKFIDFLEHDGLLGIVLDEVSGTSLEERLAVGVDLEQAIDIGIQICAGLEQAHAFGVVHRDLKPANVMLAQVGGRTHVFILDFGMAKVVFGDKLVTGLTERDMIFGTPEYMAPEQARGDDADHRCDIYAAGVILYEMLSGGVPISKPTPLATMTAQLSDPIPPLRGNPTAKSVPAALEAVVLRALEKDPERRYPSARAMREALIAASERRLVSLGSESAGLDQHDTELALRKSQIQRELGPILARAEELAKQRASDAESPQERSSSLWLWITAAVVVVSGAVGIWLAVR